MVRSTARASSEPFSRRLVRRKTFQPSSVRASVQWLTDTRHTVKAPSACL